MSILVLCLGVSTERGAPHSFVSSWATSINEGHRTIPGVSVVGIAVGIIGKNRNRYFPQKREMVLEIQTRQVAIPLSTDSKECRCLFLEICEQVGKSNSSRYWKEGTEVSLKMVGLFLTPEKSNSLNPHSAFSGSSEFIVN